MAQQPLLLNTCRVVPKEGLVELEACLCLTLRSSRGSLMYCAMPLTGGVPVKLTLEITFASASPM